MDQTSMPSHVFSRRDFTSVLLTFSLPDLKLLEGDHLFHEEGISIQPQHPR